MLIGWLLPKVSLPLSNETVHGDWSALYSPYTPNVAIVVDDATLICYSLGRFWRTSAAGGEAQPKSSLAQLHGGFRRKIHGGKILREKLRIRCGGDHSRVIG